MRGRAPLLLMSLALAMSSAPLSALGGAVSFGGRE
jgi:hypothetical protein